MFDYTLLFFYIVFQRNRGLVQDGVVGSNTWDWLLKGTKNVKIMEKVYLKINA